MFGIEEYYEGLLLEAKTTEEIKKILEYQFVQGKGVPSDVFEYITSIDPTRKLTYSRWVLLKWENEKDLITKSIQNGELKRVFNVFKNRAGSGLDINNMKTVAQAIEMLPDIDPILDKSEGTEEENNFDIVYDTPEWTIAVPHCYKADEKLGKGCRWCTAGAFGNGPMYWDRYSSEGPLWVNFDKRKSEICPMDNKEYPYKRYQFLFEWERWHGEFMDCHDHRINFGDINLPEGVKKFYAEQNEKYGEVIESGEGLNHNAWDNYESERSEHSINVFTVGRNLILMPKQNSDMDLNVPYMLYDEDDTSDSPFSFEFNPDECIIKVFGNDGRGALLETINGNKIFVFLSSNRRYGSIWEYIEIDNIINKGEYCLITSTGENSRLFCGNNGPYILKDYIGEKDFEIADFFINDKINSFIAQNRVYGFENGEWIELIYDDGYHGLIWINKNTDGYDCIVSKDIPANGVDFEPFFDDNDNLCVKGKLIHICGDGMNNNGMIIQEINDGEDYLVEYRNGRYNVWNTSLNKLLFDYPVEDIRVDYSTGMTYAVIKQADHHYFFYNFDTHQKEWKDCYSIFRVTIAFRSLDFFGCILMDGSRVLVSADDEHITECGPCYDIKELGVNIYNKFIVQREDAKWNIFDTTTHKDILPGNGVDKIMRTVPGWGSIIYCAVSSNNVIYILEINDSNIVVLPSKEGIPLSEFFMDIVTSHSHEFMFGLKGVDSIRIVYYPQHRNFVFCHGRSVVSPEAVTELTDEEKELVNRVFAGQRAEIQENFRRIYKSIIDTERRKYDE